jgi:hypothetical protein
MDRDGSFYSRTAQATTCAWGAMLGIAQHPLPCYRTHRMARVAIISDVHADLHVHVDFSS